ncbi:MAG: indolepyruvate oxidoreductase subunit beta [Clostridiales bacterium]|nr:indolepyruvate oxidoreductase subunit beta [Clostridiales bacterium]
MSDNTNVMIAGVGGQGTVLASKILGLAAMKAGMDVKQSEIHGMSQRGGSVVTHVRFGDKVHSPLVTKGSADVIMAFEELEGLRYLPYLKKTGLIIMNKQQMLPMPVIMGAAQYPVAPVEEIANLEAKEIAVDASGTGLALGDARTANVVLLGVLAAALPFPDEVWHESLRESLKPGLVEVNMKAFRAGQEAAMAM